VVSFCLLLFALLLIQGGLILLKSSFLLSLVICMLLAVPAAYLISEYLTGPISRMTEKIRKMASGYFTPPTDVQSNCRLEALSRTIDEMGLQLEQRIDEISKERDYLRTVLRGMTEGVLLVDGRGRILMVNDALRRLLHLPPDVTDKTPLEIIRNAELETAIRKVLQGEDKVSFDLTESAPGGKTFEVNVVSLLASPMEPEGRSEKGRGAIAVFHDITRLKELEKIRQDFVANVSHELRTPLTTIKGYAETLLDGALKEEIAFQFVQVIERHSDRLAKIVEDLLALSKIESRELQLKIEPFYLAESLHDVIEFLKETAGRKRISVSQQEVPRSLTVEADRNSLEQVLTNLLDNAIKYGREEGNITVSARETAEKEIQVSVQDDGMGIPKEDLPRIFERFYRVDKGRSKDLGGTGLGLSIVKHIIQAHGGRIWAESQIGKGSTFYFTLPKRKA
jgi:two-component system phosphate regulon sensor histidine kinase PhoR